MAASDAAKLSVSGAALAAILGCCAAADGDCDGLLFGCVARPPAPPPLLSDDDSAPVSSVPSLSISIAGHVSLTRPSFLSDPLGRFQLHLPSLASGTAVGFFSSRRRAAPRPSMRESALARSLSLSETLALTHPVVFLLVSPSSSPNLSVHSFDYRAFLLVDSHLVPASVHIVNVGPGFRDQYHAFAAESPMPWIPPQAPAGGYSIGEEKAVDRMVEGFGMRRVEGLVTSATVQVSGMEEMYAGMLRKLEGLARQVEESNELVLQQVVIQL
jgi:BRISC complex subunit Abro1